MAAVLAAATLAVTAPAARANQPEYDCGFNSAQQTTATGADYVGAVWGYVAHTGGGPVGIRCYITVNGVEADSTDPATGAANVAVAAGRLEFYAGDTDTVTLCAEVTSPHGSFDHCYGPTTLPFPPQPVTDLLNDLLDATETTVCAWTRFAARQGASRLDELVIEEGGDVYVAGEFVWDCAPYAS